MKKLLILFFLIVHTQKNICTASEKSKKWILHSFKANSISIISFSGPYCTVLEARYNSEKNKLSFNGTTSIAPGFPQEKNCFPISKKNFEVALNIAVATPHALQEARALYQSWGN